MDMRGSAIVPLYGNVAKAVEEDLSRMNFLPWLTRSRLGRTRILLLRN
jgi:hypothetical protein